MLSCQSHATTRHKPEFSFKQPAEVREVRSVLLLLWTGSCFQGFTRGRALRVCRLQQLQLWHPKPKVAEARQSLAVSSHAALSQRKPFFGPVSEDTYHTKRLNCQQVSFRICDAEPSPCKVPWDLQRGFPRLGTEGAGIWGDSLGAISHLKLRQGAFRGNPQPYPTGSPCIPASWFP